MAPGFKTFQFATLGHFFQIVVTVSKGGDNLEVTDVLDSRRLVTVEIVFGGNRWKQSVWIETIVLDRMTQVWGAMRSIKSKTISVVSKIKYNKKRIEVYASPISKAKT